MSMQQSWLLRYSLLIVAATTEALSYNHDTESSIEAASSVLGQNPRVGDFILHKEVVSEAIEQRTGSEGLSNRITDPIGVPVERAAAALQLPRPTAMPSLRKRQDDGQIQALSAQLQSLSQSATQAISSVSSSASSILSQMSQSAQSVRQSADQVRQSADQASQAADQASRQLSQTVSSASSAMSAADARASSQISQSLASMSSRLVSAQSSASDAVSSARVAASQFAASQIQAAAATGVRGDMNSSVEQPQSNSVSSTTLAIIIVVSIVGTAILSTLSTYLLLRYRRKKRSTRGEKALASNERTVAVRGSLSPRFPRFGGGSGSTMDEFKLPRMSSVKRFKKAQREARDNTASAASSYSDQEENIDPERDAGDTPAFRLQKDNGVGSATAIRLIRVGSEKSKARSSIDIQQPIAEPTPPLPMVAVPYQSLKPTLVSPKIQAITQPPPQPDTIITQPPKTKEPPQEERRVSARSRASIIEKPSGRPSVRLTATDPNRFRFRDSSDLESGEPTPTNLDTARLLPNRNTLSLRTPRTSNPPGQMNRNRTMPTGQPKNGKGTFATFPRIRNDLPRRSEPPRPPRDSMMNRQTPQRESSMMNRGRPNRNTRLRGEGERRPGDFAYMSGNMNMNMNMGSRRDTLNGRY